LRQWESGGRGERSLIAKKRRRRKIGRLEIKKTTTLTTKERKKGQTSTIAASKGANRSSMRRSSKSLVYTKGKKKKGGAKGSEQTSPDTATEKSTEAAAKARGSRLLKRDQKRLRSHSYNMRRPFKALGRGQIDTICGKGKGGGDGVKQDALESQREETRRSLHWKRRRVLNHGGIKQLSLLEQDDSAAKRPRRRRSQNGGRTTLLRSSIGDAWVTRAQLGRRRGGSALPGVHDEGTSRRDKPLLGDGER